MQDSWFRQLDDPTDSQVVRIVDVIELSDITPLASITVEVNCNLDERVLLLDAVCCRNRLCRNQIVRLNQLLRNPLDAVDLTGLPTTIALEVDEVLIVQIEFTD